MKGFLVGVIATVLATVLGYFAIEASKGALKPKAELTIAEFDPTFTLGASKAKEWEAKVKPLEVDSLDTEQRLMVTAFTIENTGSIPLENQRVVIKPKYDDSFAAGVIDFQNDTFPGILGDDTVMKLENKSLFISYKLLDKGEFHRFWVVHDRYTTLQQVTRSPDLEVSKWDAMIFLRRNEEDYSSYWFAGFVVSIIICFAVGFVSADRYFRSIVVAQGLSYKEFIDAGTEAKSAKSRLGKDD